MPIPKNFDCNEVHLSDEEIEAFQTAILNLSGIVEDNEPYHAAKAAEQRLNRREAQNFSKAERKEVYAQEKANAAARDEKFLTGNKAACKNGLLALKNLPEGRDPKSMFAWVKQFPQLLWRDNLKLAFDRYGEGLSLNENDRQTINKNFDLAKSWYDLFSASRYFNVLYDLSDFGADYERTDAKDSLKKFQAKADEMNIPARDEEVVAEETGAFDAPEEPAAEEEIQNEVEEEINVEPPKEEINVEVPAQNEKIKPYNITKDVYLSEESTHDFSQKIDDENEQNRSLKKKIKADIHYQLNDFSADAASKDSLRRFHELYGDTIKEELKMMLAGPKAHTPERALEWICQFPHVMTAYGIASSSMKGFEEFSQEHMDLAREWWNFFTDDHSKRNNYNTTKNSYRVDELEYYSESLYDKAWKAVHKAEKTKIDSIVEKLENAKTFYNSGEYNQIIDVAKMLYHTDELPKKFKDSAKTPEAIHAFKLASIKARIDAYIDHKAKDGVKPNVYHKLAAVEELNRYVSEELNRIGVKHIPGGLPAITTVNGQVPMSLAEEPNAALLKSYHAYAGSLISDEQEECRRTLDCMGRIMLSANALNLGEETMGKLDQLATAFQNGPDVDLNAPQEDTLLNDNPDEMPVIDC